MNEHTIDSRTNGKAPEAGSRRTRPSRPEALRRGGPTKVVAGRTARATSLGSGAQS